MDKIEQLKQLAERQFFLRKEIYEYYLQTKELWDGRERRRVRTAYNAIGDGYVTCLRILYEQVTTAEDMKVIQEWREALQRKYYEEFEIPMMLSS